MDYEDVDIQNEQDKEENTNQNIVYTPNITYIVKNNHKILKNTLFYMVVAVLLFLNVIFILDLSSTEFTSVIAQGVRDFFNAGQQATQISEYGTTYVNIFNL